MTRAVAVPLFSVILSEAKDLARESARHPCTCNPLGVVGTMRRGFKMEIKMIRVDE